MMNTKDDSSAFNNFKKREKQYKFFVDKKTDFSELITLPQHPSTTTPFTHPSIKSTVLTHPRTGRPLAAYTIPTPAGLIIIKNYTEPLDQLTIARQCINQYWKSPHRTNLYIYEKVELKGSINDLVAKEEDKDCKEGKDEVKISEKEGMGSTGMTVGGDAGDCPCPCAHPMSAKAVENEPNTSTTGNKGGARDYNKEHYMVSDHKRYFFNSKIRWSNVGYQYNWDKRDYYPVASPIPIELSSMAKEVIGILNLGGYNPEALIINYYGARNFMGGHLDDGEPDQEHPIVSFSLGLSCVFLIGGRTKDTDPLAIRLDSGDVMIMSGESRRCYHGVPRILEDSVSLINSSELPKLAQQLDTETQVAAPHDPANDSASSSSQVNTFTHTVNYLRENRININFRQVVKDKQNK